MVVGTSVNAIARNGMLRNRRAVDVAQLYSLDRVFPEVTTAEVADLIQNDAATVVDVRKSEAFEAGSIPGAINIPPIASAHERRSRLSEVKKQQRIVVFCESWRCRWADRVADSLILDGYRQVAVYRAGWEEWKNRGEQ